MLKVYDEVWIMENNAPKEKLVFAVVESMSYFKACGKTDVHYQLVNSTLGAGWGNNEGVRREGKDIFETKEQLIESLSAKTK